MRLCRFNGDRLGWVRGDRVYDITQALDVVAAQTWPIQLGDPLMIHLPQLRKRIDEVVDKATSIEIERVILHSPLCNPSKVMAAPANYRKHVEIDAKDPEIDAGVHNAQLSSMDKPTEELGLFLKANSSIVGPGDGVIVALPDRRTDHEVELAVVIGKQGKNISASEALDYVGGYCLGLDMTIRGKEDRSFRKSADSYTVLGPWIVTADEIENPESLDIGIEVNGNPRQSSNTSALTVGIRRMIEKASSIYTLFPGDVILTGTPEGVGQVIPGDVMTAWCNGIGKMTVAVSGPRP